MAEDFTLTPAHALGGAAALHETIGPFTLCEMQRAIHTLAGSAPPGSVPPGHDPVPGALLQQGDALLWWGAPELWYLAGAALPDAAGVVVDQSDGWLWLDIEAPPAAIEVLFARLCDIDLPALRAPFSARSLVEHHGVWLLGAAPGQVALLGTRSSARSLYRAVAEAARSVTAQRLV